MLLRPSVRRSDLFGDGSSAVVDDASARLEFQAVSWHAGDEDAVADEEDDDDEQQQQDAGAPPPQEFVIRAFGVMADGRSACLTVRSFTPHFYVKVNPRCTPGQVRALREYFLSQTRLDVLKVTPLLKKDFYGFRNGRQEAFMRLDFRTLRGMRIMAAKVSRGVEGRGVSFNAGDIRLYESNIDPLLRFMHTRDIQPAGWLAVEAADRLPPPAGPSSKCEVECDVNWTRVHAMRHRHDSAPLVVASWDIECNSSHGDFPMAKKDYTKLAWELPVAFRAAFPPSGGFPGAYEGTRFIERCLLQVRGPFAAARLRSPCPPA